MIRSFLNFCSVEKCFTSNEQNNEPIRSYSVWSRLCRSRPSNGEGDWAKILRVSVRRGIITEPRAFVRDTISRKRPPRRSSTPFGQTVLAIAAHTITYKIITHTHTMRYNLYDVYTNCRRRRRHARTGMADALIYSTLL